MTYLLLLHNQACKDWSFFSRNPTTSSFIVHIQHCNSIACGICWISYRWSISPSATLAGFCWKSGTSKHSQILAHKLKAEKTKMHNLLLMEFW
jgi:hypothetical protein